MPLGWPIGTTSVARMLTKLYPQDGHDCIGHNYFCLQDANVWLEARAKRKSNAMSAISRKIEDLGFPIELEDFKLESSDDLMYAPICDQSYTILHSCTSLSPALTDRCYEVHECFLCYSVDHKGHRACMHTCMHIHEYMHACIHACMHTCMHT